MKPPRGPDRKPRKRRTDKHAGPGRPQGSKGVLPKGAVGAVLSLRHRVPGSLPEAIAEIADEAFQTVVDVMRGRIHHETTARLNAARYVRDECCGPIAQKLDLEVKHGLADRLTRAMAYVDESSD